MCVSECDIHSGEGCGLCHNSMDPKFDAVFITLYCNLDYTKNAVSNSCILATLSHDYDIKHTCLMSTKFTGNVPSAKKLRLDPSLTSQGTYSTYCTI